MITFIARRYRVLRNFIAMFTLGLLVVSCGGGGGSSNSNPAATATLSGTAATGIAYDGSINVYGANGGSVLGVPVDASGNYAVDVTGLTPPYLILGIPSASSTQAPLASSAAGPGTANIDPLTTLTLFLANGEQNPAQLATTWPTDSGNISTNLPNSQAVVSANLAGLFSAINAALNIDFITYDVFSAPFSIGSIYDQILDLISIDISSGTLVMLVGNVSFPFDPNINTSNINIGGTTQPINALVGTWEATSLTVNGGPNLAGANSTSFNTITATNYNANETGAFCDQVPSPCNEKGTVTATATTLTLVDDVTFTPEILNYSLSGSTLTLSITIGVDAVVVVLQRVNPIVTLGGTISGLTGTVVLQNNGGNNLSSSANGAFTFTGTVRSGTGYNVTVLTQPTGQTCSVSGGSGTVTPNVTSIVVNCSGGSGGSGIVEFNLSTLDPSNGGDGSTGKIIREEATTSFSTSGERVGNAGDVNGDGFDDVVIGQHGSPPLSSSHSGRGQVHILFGGLRGLPALVDISTLDGSNGFTVGAPNGMDSVGYAVDGAGDFNGDGYADLIVGSATTILESSWLVHGHPNNFSTKWVLGAPPIGESSSSIDAFSAGDNAGVSVSGLGDINNDGLDDIAIGAPTAIHLGSPLLSGKAYVVFGEAAPFSRISLGSLSGSVGPVGTRGFELKGLHLHGRAGHSVSGAGDVNGDGINDLIIGEPFNGFGQAYVVFGHSTAFPASFDLSSLDGSNGFILNGPEAGLGWTVSSAGDFNGDGQDDILVVTSVGTAYLVYGRTSAFPASIDLSALSATEGFKIAGFYSGNFLDVGGVSGAGDVNNDGFDDILVGSITGSPGGVVNAGVTYLVFGRAQNFGPGIDLSSRQGYSGVIFNGYLNPYGFSGISVSRSGDVDSDGYDDILIRGIREIYLVYGQKF